MKNIAVIMGGKSSEHSVSLETGINVVCNLDRKKYKIFPIKIELDGVWMMLPEYTQSMPRTVYKKLVENNHLETKKLSIAEAFVELQKASIDFIFIALHGEHGEDGSIQGVCEQFGFAYNGSGVLASALSIDKLKSSLEFERVGLKAPAQIEINKDFSLSKENIKNLSNQIDRELQYPCFIKPRFGGSSVGAGIANNEKELIAAIKNAQKTTKNILAQKLIKGREFTVGILEEKSNPIALVPTEIISKTDFFDFNSKYNSENKAEEVTPAQIPPAQASKLQYIALKAHSVLGCSGYSRVDIIFSDDEYYVLEINSLPGLTSESILPLEAKAQGIEFSDLLDKIIENGFLSVTQ